MGSIVRSTGYVVLHRPVELARLIGMWPFALGRDGTPHDDPISLEENSKMCQRQAFTARISWQSEPRQPGSKSPAQQATISPATHCHTSCEARYQKRLLGFRGPGYETGLIASNVRLDVGSSHPSTLTGYDDVRSTNFGNRGDWYT